MKFIQTTGLKTEDKGIYIAIRHDCKGETDVHNNVVTDKNLV